MKFIDKLKFELKLISLKKVVKKALKEENLNENFELDNGGNGIVLFPNDKIYEGLCIKIPMNSKFKEEYLREIENITVREIVSGNIGKKTNLNEDYNSYKKIIKTKELIKFMPKVYYPKIKKKNVEMIIMDRLIGSKVKLLNPTKTNLTPLEKELQNIYLEFLKHGFVFADNLEGIKDDNKGRVLVYDFDLIIKDNTNN